MRIAWFVVEAPVAVLPSASVGPHSMAPSTVLEVWKLTRNDAASASQMAGPRVRLWPGNDGCKKARMEPRGPMMSPRWRMVGKLIGTEGGTPVPYDQWRLGWLAKWRLIHH